MPKCVIWKMEDGRCFFILGAIESNQHTRGNLPVGYKKMHTLEDVGDFILKLQANDDKKKLGIGEFPTSLKI